MSSSIFRCRDGPAIRSSASEALQRTPAAIKVNLGVGVYYDDNGKIPLLAAVPQRRKSPPKPSRRAATSLSKATPPTTVACRTCSSARIWPAANGQVVTIQALRGTGALKVGADYLKRLRPDAVVYIPDPSWEKPPRH